MASKKDYEKFIKEQENLSFDLIMKVAKTKLFKNYQKAIEEDGLDPDTLIDMAQEKAIFGINIVDNCYAAISISQEAVAKDEGTPSPSAKSPKKKTTTKKAVTKKKPATKKKTVKKK